MRKLVLFVSCNVEGSKVERRKILKLTIFTTAVLGLGFFQNALASDDYPFFSPAAYFNRPLSYWDLEVDGAATQVITNWLGGSYWDTHKFAYIALDVASTYWVHDGDPDVEEYLIVRKYNGTLTPWQCPIAGAAATYRIPTYAKAQGYLNTASGQDRHMFIVDVDRNLVLSLYSWWYDDMGFRPGNVYQSQHIGCDVLHGDDAKIMEAEMNRWSANGWQGWGYRGIGGGIDAGGATTLGGNSLGGPIYPQDFSVPGDDLGHVLSCSIPVKYGDGISWPGLGGTTYTDDNFNIKLFTVGTVMRINPSWSIPVGTPAWEARILRTWQRYGCMIDDGGNGSVMTMRGQARWTGSGGSDPWEGVIPKSAVNANGVVFLPNFPRYSVQVMKVNSRIFQQKNLAQPTPPPFILSNRGELSVEIGKSASIPITANLVSGASQTLSFSANNLPTGASFSYSPATCVPSSSSPCSVDLNISADNSATEGTYEIGVSASGSGTIKRTTFTLEVISTESPMCIDVDGDGFGTVGTDLNTCSSSTTIADCDDNNANVYCAEYYVCDTGSACNVDSVGWSNGDDANSKKQAQAKATPWKSIQKAADVMAPGDTVIVGSGEYHRTWTNTAGLVSIVYDKGGFAGKPKTFKSEIKYGAVLIGTSPSTGSGFFLYGTGTDYINIEGFEMKDFTGGGGVSVQGGGYITNNITVRNNYFHNNGRRLFGDGISGTGVVTSSGAGNNWLVDGNIFYNNGRLQHDPPFSTDKNQDHDIYVGGNNNIIQNNLFYGVHASGWNIHYHGSYTTNLKIINNTFAGYNPYVTGNVILWEAQNGTLVQNNIFSNPLTKAALRCYGSGTTVANNNLVASGLPLVNVECNGGGKGVVTDTGTITGDPKFNIGTDVYTLQFISPAVNKGLSADSPAYDLTGKQRNGLPDIGAYEHQGIIINLADVNGDGNVNIKDIQEVIRCIINSQTCAFPDRSDVNNDERINIKDIQEIIREIINP